MNFLLIFSSAVVGLLLGDFLHLSYYFTAVQSSGGYLCRALWRVVPHHLVSLIVRGLLIVALLLPFGLESSSALLIALVIGLMVVTVEVGVDETLKRGGSEQRFSGTFFRYIIRSLVRLNIFINFRYGYVVQLLKERDNFDCQQGRGYWNLGLEVRQQLPRKLRMIFEIHKDAIAKRKAKPSLRRHRYGSHPFQNFYLLVDTLGRRRLRTLLLNDLSPPPPGVNWIGNERRRHAGIYADRVQPDPNPQYKRGYDYPAQD